MLLASEAVASYGENFRRLRGPASQEEIARRLKLKRQANISAIELGDKVPSVKMILRHASALRQPPSELMKDVETEYDRIRAGAYDVTRQTNISVSRASTPASAGSARKRDGRVLAPDPTQTLSPSTERHGQTGSVPDETRPRHRSLRTRIVSEARAIEEEQTVEPPRAPRQPAPAARHATTSHRVSDRKRRR